MTDYEYMIFAAKRSRFNGRHWFRYLRKVIFKDYTYLSNMNVQRLLSSDELTLFQKVTLKCAVQIGSPTHVHVVSLGKPAKLSNIQKLKEKFQHG